MIVEVGGTVGDIEGQPFLEAIRQIRREERPEDTLSHPRHVPPARRRDQRAQDEADAALRPRAAQHGHPARRHPLPRRPRGHGRDPRARSPLFCDVEERGVIRMATMESIYQVPIVLEDENLGDYVIELLKLDAAPRDLTPWRQMVERLQNPTGEVDIAVVGKYVELHDAYLSIKEALIHAGIAHTRAREHPLGALANAWSRSRSSDPARGRRRHPRLPGLRRARHRRQDRGGALRAREQDPVPRRLPRHADDGHRVRAQRASASTGANSTEIDPQTPHPVISLLGEQLGVEDKGGTMRLGGYPARSCPARRPRRPTASTR